MTRAKQILAVSLLFCTLVRAQAPPNSDLAGTWTGTLGFGYTKLHLALIISRDNSVYSGQLNSKDQHAVLSMENITLSGDAVRFEVGRVGGLYVGTMSKDRMEIAGTWTQTGVPVQPLNFKREVAQPPAANEKPGKAPTDDLAVVPIDVSVPNPPIAFKADGRWDLAYELRIASLADKGDYTLTHVDILGTDGKPLVSYSAETLAASVDPEAVVGTTLRPRTFTTIFMWLSASTLQEIPSELRHRVTVKPSDSPDEISTATQPVPIDRKRVIIISPPLRGDDWLAANGPSNGSVHRRAMLPLQGRAFIGQRFAIDWAQVYPDGRPFLGNELDNKNYRSYGQPVYAVADGTVTEVKEGIPENVPGENSRAVEITFETVAGNHVIEKITDGAFATYAHMQPGSVRVKLGDHVSRGQVLGLLGNSGNSTAPHLHFQVCDANSVLGCEGLPYAISSFDVTGRWKPGAPAAKHEMEIPTEGEVVNFGGK